MSFRGGSRGGRGGGGSRGGFTPRGGRGGFQASTGPPDTVLEMGSVMHACEGEILCQSINPKVPYFNAPIYLQNKTIIGKVDEILGPMNEVFFTVKPQDGVVAASFKQGDKFYIGPDKLLPLERFLPKPKATGPKPPKSSRGGPRGGARGASRGGRSGFTPRGRGAPRGGGGARGGRGGFTPRGGNGFTPRARGASRGGGGFRGRGSY